MKIPSPLSPLSRLKRTSHLNEINNILELLPQATMLVDISQQQIILANSRAAELSGFTRSELKGIGIDELFDEQDRLEIAAVIQQREFESFILNLLQRNRPGIEVQAEIHEISGDNPWHLLCLEPVSEIQNREAEHQRQESLLERLGELVDATQKEDLQKALQWILELGIELTAAPIMAIYQAQGKNLELRRSASIGQELPERLSSQDLIHLHIPQIWLPGKKTHASLQSYARAEGFTYLASIPIGDQYATIGLLVAADTSAPPREMLLPILKILAGEASSVFHHFYRYLNLEEKLELELRHRRFAETVQNAMDDMLIVLSKELKVIRLNRSAEMGLGYSDHEAHNLPYQHILIGKENLQPMLEMALAGIPTLNQEDLRFFRRSGEAFSARVNILPVNENSQVDGIIILIKDMSEQEITKSQTERLEQTALLGTVTAIFAHEVRNPINNISTGLQLMAYNLQEGDPQLELILKLQQDCDRLEGLMKSVLSFARSTEYEMSPVDLSLLVSRLVERMRPKLAAARIDYHIKVDPDTPLVMGNPLALEQVFQNLITNAIQAMDATGGILAVKVQPSETTGKRRHALVIIADNGPGIPKENLDKIFTPFFTTKNNGTGLGLAITKRIVTAHKGIILANSFPGGTVFSIQIPAIE